MGSSSGGRLFFSYHLEPSIPIEFFLVVVWLGLAFGLVARCLGRVILAPGAFVVGFGAALTRLAFAVVLGCRLEQIIGPLIAVSFSSNCSCLLGSRWACLGSVCWVGRAVWLLLRVLWCGFGVFFLFFGAVVCGAVVWWCFCFCGGFACWLRVRVVCLGFLLNSVHLRFHFLSQILSWMETETAIWLLYSSWYFY